VLFRSPSLLLEGPWYWIVLDSVTAGIGIICLAAAVQGHVRRDLLWWERLILAATAVLFIVPTWETMLFAAAVLVILWLRIRGAEAREAGPNA